MADRLKHHLRLLIAMASVVILVGCASLPAPHDDGRLQREAVAGTEKPVPPPLPLNTGLADTQAPDIQPQLSTGSGKFYKPTALARPVPAAKGEDAVTFNFENQPIQAVVKAILGDLLKKNYTIAPSVQGNISFATAEPIDESQALPILEMLLSWTNNALVNGRSGYVVVKAKDAVGGNLSPGLNANAPSGGLQARLYPLHYIGAAEMQKLIKPFARPDSLLLVDPARNLLVMSGTPEELANYQRTVHTFDVDWLRGTSVGVFSLQRASVTDLMPKLESLFGKNGDTPLAGLLRFIPIERTNALVVISTQPDYLREVGDWITRIDRGGGNEPQLFVYDVRNLKASNLAHYLAQIYAQGGGGGGGDNGGQVGPGLSSGTLGSAGSGLGGGLDNGNGGNGFGNSGGGLGDSSGGGLGGGLNGGAGGGRDGGGLGGGSGLDGVAGGNSGLGGNTGSGSGGGLINNVGGAGGGGAGGGSGDQQYSSSDGSIRISSVDANNQLLVRARPSQWSEIQEAIKRLDNVPLQVQIETRILEVSLTGQFRFGVQWYLKGLVGSTIGPNNTFVPPPLGNNNQFGALGQGGPGFNGEPFFYSFLNSNLQVAVRALETSGNTKTLSAPSMVVMNNQSARIQVGNQVPINQSSVSAGIGQQVFNQVSYLNTGVILNVQPRVNPGGLVYMNIAQQVSQVDASKALVNGNPTVSQRQLATQVAVQSGQTVLLGGLIQQNDGNTDTGTPGLNRIPILGRLFGQTDRSQQRTELVVLITPRVIASSDDARQITEEYQQKFESLAPLRAERAERAERVASRRPAQTTPLPAPPPLPPPTPEAAATPTPAPRDARLASFTPSNDPVELQRQAQIALKQRDYKAAQLLALRSWKAGTRQGALCAQNWQVIGAARNGMNDDAGAQTAARWVQQCRKMAQ